jgi:hypothetical protein
VRKQIGRQSNCRSAGIHRAGQTMILLGGRARLLFAVASSQVRAKPAGKESIKCTATRAVSDDDRADASPETRARVRCRRIKILLPGGIDPAGQRRLSVGGAITRLPSPTACVPMRGQAVSNGPSGSRMRHHHWLRLTSGRSPETPEPPTNPILPGAVRIPNTSFARFLVVAAAREARQANLLPSSLPFWPAKRLARLFSGGRRWTPKKSALF